MADAEARGSVSRNTAVMAAGTAVSRVLGIVRNMLLVAAVGLTGSLAADAFAVGNWLPNIAHMLLAGGVLNAVLVPQIVRAYRSAGGREYTDRLLTLALVIFAVETVVLTLAAPLIAQAIVVDDAAARLATVFAYWCLPQVFFYGLYGLLGQVLNARGLFGPYMWAPVVNNVVAIAGLIAFLVVFGGAGGPTAAEDLSIWTGSRIALLAGTATLGVVGQAVFLLVPLYRSGFRYRPRGQWRGAGLGNAGRVAGWTLAALAVGQVSVLAVMKIASAASATNLPAVAGNQAYNNAFAIFMLPQSLVTVSIVTALYTRLSDHAAARDVRSVRADFSQGLRTIAVFTLFAGPALAVLAVPIVGVLYPTATADEVTAMAPIVVAFMAGVAGIGAWTMCTRIFYAYEDAKGLFRIQVYMAVVVVVGAVLGYLLAPPRLWVAWAAAAMSASYLVGSAWAGAQVWRRLGGGLGRLIRVHVRAGLAGVGAAGVGWAVTRLFGNLAAGGVLRSLIACVLAGSVMVAVYVVALRALRVSELDDFLEPFLARLGRSMRSPGPAAEPAATAAQVPAPGGRPAGRDRGGDRLDVVIGRGTLLAGRYRLHQPVGSDLPDAQVWSARDQILDRPVRAVVLTGGNIAAAQDAARRAALVSDPRLLRVLDVGDHEGVAYVVTEPVVGQDLAQLTATGPLPADQARAVVGEAAAALEVARRRGVHHLALRPSAVHVAPDGTVLVAGLAMDGELFGHAHGDAKATSRADTVGLVALLYLALTGHRPDVPGAVPGPAGQARPGDAGDVVTPDGAGGGTPAVAPAVGGLPVPPAELVPAVPNDLDTLCVVTLGPHDDGPHSPGELVRELEPWPAVDAQAVYDALDAATRTGTVPSGPWSGGGGGAVGAAGGAGAVGAAGAAAGGLITSVPGTAGPTTPAAQVQRQSVRQSVRPAAPDAGARPGTPPSAAPTRPFAGSAPGAPPGAPPSVPPRVPPGGARPTRTARPDPGEDFDALLDAPVPITRRQVNATPIVLGIIAVLVAVGLFWAMRSLFAPAPPIGGEGGLDLTEEEIGGDATPTPDPEATDPTEPTEPTDPGGDAAAPAGPPVVVSAQMIDPPPGGDNNEHPEAVDRAIDGDPGTYWYSRTYRSATYGMKPGVGYAVTLQEEATVTSVRLLVNGTGGQVEVRATDPSTPTEGTVLASGALSPETVLTLSTPTPAQHIVLWFPALPQTPDGSNRIELYEVTVS